MRSYDTLSDQELTECLREDDRTAFETIYRRYWPILLDIAWKRLSDLASAEEVVQDIFISLYINRTTLHIHTSLPGYLKTALKYKVLNVYRSRMVRQHTSLDEEAYEAAVHIEPHAALDARELERLIDEGIGQLPDKCREVFILSRKEHLSHEMIANRLGISVSTVEKHIGKALRVVRAYIADVQIITIFVAFNHLHSR